MLCPHCGKELERQETFCPFCHQALTPSESASPTEPRAEAAPEAPSPAPYLTQAPEKVCELPSVPQVKRGHSETGRNLFFAAVLLALAALLAWGVVKAADRPEEEAPTLMQPVTRLARNRGKSGSAVAGAQNIVAETDTLRLTNQEFLYYYWDSFFSTYGSYGDYLTMYLDFSVPFDQQMASSEETWNDYFTRMALDSWFQSKTLCAQARENGYTLSQEERDYVDSSASALEGYAADNGYADGNGYLQSIFDPCAERESYLAYIEDSVLANSYAGAKYDELYAQAADPDAEMKYCVNVRHILIQPEAGTDIPDNAAAQAKAEEVLALWRQNPTAEYFAELAGTYSADGGSNRNGGLYEDIHPGQMVAAFNDWCFDPIRGVGDTGIVLTEYGYHVMYFDGVSETIYSDPNEEAAAQAYHQWLDDLFASADYRSYPENIVFTRKAD